MECSEPGAIRDEELMAYLSGEQVRPGVAQHIAHCQSCSSRLAQYQAMERTLTSRLFRYDCPPSQIVGEYRLRLLSKDQASQVAGHLRQCAFCSAEAAQLDSFLAGDPLLVERAPVAQNSSQRRQEIEQVTRQIRDQVGAGVRRIAALLLPPQPGLAFQRSAAQQAIWPRRYSAEDISIAVQVERASGHGDALQVLGIVNRAATPVTELQGTTVQLLAGSTVAYTESLDDLGNFLFSSVAPATYTLELHVPSGIIVVEPLPVYANE